MPLLPRLSSLWRNLFHKARKEQELTEEIEAYVEMLVEQKINEGIDPAEARRAALIELGGREQVKEKVRESRAGHYLETIWQDLRYGLQMMRRNPGFACVAILTLALGIGANTAIFSVVNAVLLKPLPYSDPQRLVWIAEVFRGGAEMNSTADYIHFQEQSKTLDHLAAFTSGRVDLTGRGEPERLDSVRATATLFPAFGVAPQLGRAFTPEEDRPGGAPVVILSHAFWQRRFGGDPGVVGQSLTLNGRDRQVIGVMPPGFKFIHKADVLLPRYGWDLRRHFLCRQPAHA
jgi:putative ABC transport system permease protein